MLGAVARALKADSSELAHASKHASKHADPGIELSCSGSWTPTERKPKRKPPKRTVPAGQSGIAKIDEFVSARAVGDTFQTAAVMSLSLAQSRATVVRALAKHPELEQRGRGRGANWEKVAV